jgi:transcriptional regulator with XRE-family HTH domain
MRHVHPVDRLVGQRVRLARIAKGLSQTGLGHAVGVTFQQIQKYEKGANRISASRLSDLAAILGVNIGYFFEDGDGHTDLGKTGHSNALVANLSRADFAILRSLSGIKDARIKRKLADLIGCLASGAKSDRT